MPVGEIAALPEIHLALLQEDAEVALTGARMLKDRLEGAIALRYADRAAELRREQGKDTGTVRFEDGDVVVVADLLWDQAELVALVERIRAGGDDLAEYVEVVLQGAGTEVRGMARPYPRGVRAGAHGPHRQADLRPQPASGSHGKPLTEATGRPVPRAVLRCPVSAPSHPEQTLSRSRP